MISEYAIYFIKWFHHFVKLRDTMSLKGQKATVASLHTRSNVFSELGVQL